MGYTVMSDARVPLNVRVMLANAALHFAAMLVEGNTEQREEAARVLHMAVEDVQICIQAFELGMLP